MGRRDRGGLQEALQQAQSRSVPMFLCGSGGLAVLGRTVTRLDRTADVISECPAYGLVCRFSRHIGRCGGPATGLTLAPNSSGKRIEPQVRHQVFHQ